MATEGCEPIVQNRPTPDLSVSDIKMPTYTRQESSLNTQVGVGLKIRRSQNNKKNA